MQNPLYDSMEGSQQNHQSTRERLILIGRLIHGEKWQTPLSFDLSDIMGKRIQPQEISRWQAGVKPTPEWMDDALKRCAAIALERLNLTSQKITQIYPDLAGFRLDQSDQIF